VRTSPARLLREFHVDAEVHRANFSKLDHDGRPVRRADGKVLRSDRYRPPDVASVLRRQGWSDGSP
jgi:predicted HAD superfamily Cof-like phosphohydrolase